MLLFVDSAPIYGMKQSSYLKRVIIVITLIAGVFFAVQKIPKQLFGSFIRPTIETKRLAAEPVELSIPSINLETHIEPVGEAPDTTMDIPKDQHNAGWWERGARPGEIGSAVLDGHVDLKEGGPGIFYRLSELKAGDRIMVTDASEKTYVFQVVDRKMYKEKDVPLEYVFARKDKKRLNLITCAGSFDRQNENYLDRLVVYAEME